MKRLKTFLIYALLIAAFWVFSDILINIVVKGGQQNTNNTNNVNTQQVNVI